MPDLVMLTKVNNNFCIRPVIQIHLNLMGSPLARATTFHH